MRSIEQELKKLADKKRAKASAWFFKTGKGQYGEGDVFLGITVPVQRIVARAHANLPLAEIQKLLQSKIHEHRFVALAILVLQYEQGSADKKLKVYKFYLKNSHRINNWDLADTSAPHIVGRYLLHRPRGVLVKLARSKKLWERRISIVSTYTFIRSGEFGDTLKISEMLLGDKHDLIHKAVGWMLREVGKKNEKVLKGFLTKHASRMPRTALRYAIERLPKPERDRYLGR